MPDIKPGLKTTELWLTVATHATWIVAFIFHRDVSAYVPAVAAGMAAVATIAYAVSRANLKKPHSLADVVADAEALLPALIALVGDGKAVVEKLKPVSAAPAKKATAPPAAVR